MSELSDLLIAFNAPLLKEMVQLKYETMSENPFKYYRGICRQFLKDYKHKSFAA